MCIHELAAGLVQQIMPQHLQKVNALEVADLQVSCMDKEGMLANIHLFRIIDLAQQVSFLINKDYNIALCTNLSVL